MRGPGFLRERGKPLLLVKSRPVFASVCTVESSRGPKSLTFSVSRRLVFEDDTWVIGHTESLIDH